MVGCRYNAKNTLDKNYLYLAEKHGARVFPETRVVDVVPLERQAGRQRRIRGANGEFDRLDRKEAAPVYVPRRRLRRVGAGHDGSPLPPQAERLAARPQRLPWRPRAHECRVADRRARARRREDLSKGIAIGSGIYIDEHTHIEAVRYPAGSDAMGLLATPLTGGSRLEARILRWLGTLAGSLLRHPWRTARCLHPFGWARESLIFLCMQIARRAYRDAAGPSLVLAVPQDADESRRRIPTYIPRANEFAQIVAKMTGGTPMSMVTEILFDVPGTAHILGGCPMAGTRVDRRGRPAQSRVRLPEYVYLRRLGDRREPGGQSQPDDLRPDGAGYEFIPPAAETRWNDVAEEGV